MSWLLIALWGVVVGLDGTSVLQSMISRPLVAATITGAILGHPTEGLAIGIVLELFSLVVLPIGAARYPESGISAVVAAFVYVEAAKVGLEPAALGLAVVFGLIWEWVAGGSVIGLRRMNEWLMADAPIRGALGPGRLERLHLSAIALDAVRAVAVVLTGSWLGHWLLGSLLRHWSPDNVLTSRVLAVATATVLGAALPIFGGWKTRRLAFSLGLVCGLMLLLLR